MLNWYKNQKIGRKLTFAFLMIIGLLILVTAIAIISLNSITNNARSMVEIEGQIADYSAHSIADILAARRAEKNYLLHYKDLGFEEAYNLYIVEMEAEIAAVIESLDSIRELDTNVEEVARISAIEADIEEHLADFLATVTLIETRGHHNTGLEGEFRTKVHEIEAVVAEDDLDRLTIDLLTIRRHEKDYLLRQDEVYVTGVRTAVADFKRNIAASELSPTQQAELVGLLDEYQVLFDQLVEIDQEIALGLEQAEANDGVFASALDEIYEGNLAEQAAAFADMQAAATFAIWSTVGVSLVAILIGLILSTLLSRSISGSVNRVAGVAQRIAEGDLTATISAEGKDELGQMALAFQQMIANLRSLIGQVQTSARQVASASQQLNVSSDQAGAASQQVTQSIQQVATGTSQQTQSVTEATVNVEQIARASEGIARGAQEQAKAVQQTATLITEMAQLVDGVNDITGALIQANVLVSEAAQEGVTAVAQTTDGMNTIRNRTTDVSQKVRDMSHRSKEIGRIVETIDDIADKTDMLALNAAVEAARAGEHGRGFAVVADQVRKLSEDSKVATRDIADLIERVQETIDAAIMAMEGAMAEVDRGTNLAQDTTASLQKIQQAVRQATRLSEKINDAAANLKNKNEGVIVASESVSAVVEENTAVAEEMAANSQEVTSVMETIASVSEENSAASEEVSAASEEMAAQIEEVVASSEELSALADDLYQATTRFYLGDGETELYNGESTEQNERPLARNGQPQSKQPAHRPAAEPVLHHWGNGGPHQN